LMRLTGGFPVGQTTSPRLASSPKSPRRTHNQTPTMRDVCRIVGEWGLPLAIGQWLTGRGKWAVRRGSPSSSSKAQSIGDQARPMVFPRLAEAALEGVLRP
jgi:hypothetical protein